MLTLLLLFFLSWRRRVYSVFVFFLKIEEDENYRRFQDSYIKNSVFFFFLKVEEDKNNKRFQDSYIKNWMDFV